jgi:diguanylate cyclase (GGDEF)-like protein
MERSAEWTRIIKRSKGAGSIALVVMLVCAIFGVGGAAAGDGSYARHVREARLHARLAGAALAHRSPAQLLLAVTPKTPAAPAPTPAATTTSTATTPAPTVTTTAATQVAPASTTPANTTSDATPGSATSTDNDGGTANPPTGATLTDTTTTGTTTTGTTTTGTTTTGTTTTGTTTTGTTTTGTTTTGTTTTTPPSNAAGTSGTSTGTTGNGFTGTGSNAATGANHLPGSGSGSTTPECHGRCSGLGQGTTSGVVPTSTPSSTTSTAATTGFTLGVSPITSTPSTATTPVTTTTPTDAVSTSGSLNLTPTTTPTSTSSTNSGAAGFVNLTSGLKTLTSSAAFRKVTQTSTQGGHATLLASAGTGGTGAGTLGGGPTAPTAGTAAGTTGRTSGTTGHASAKAKTSGKPKHQNTGGSTPFTPAVRVIDQVVKVIPTALWVALGAAFGLALVCAAVALRSSRRARRREREFTAISAAAQTDPLTGILNRRGFMDAAERELARASRYNRPFVLAYVDVRGLKAVNDTEGHLMGDELIKTVAGLMKESARADDVVGRIGGDEFALLLGEQTAESAEPVVRRIRARVAERRAAMEIGMPWELTIGLAAFPQDGTTLEELLGIADRRLYEQRGIALR